MAEAQLTPEQHATRAKGIGSSDASAAVGMSPWKTPVELWLEKTGRVEREDIGHKDIIHFGNVLEDVVAKEFTRRRGHKVQRKNTPYFRRFESGLVMVANIDRLIVGQDSILECKTADKFTRQKWEEVPDHYRLQVEHQLVTAEKDRAVLAVLIGGNQYEDFDIERHPEMSDFLIARETEFWKHVINDTAPEPINAEDVARLYPVDSGKIVIADVDLMMLHEELMAIRATCKRMDKQKDSLTEKIKMLMGEDAEVILEPGGKPIVTWKTAKGSDFTHWDRIAAEMQPLVPGDEYTRIMAAHSGTYDHGSRRFLPKEIKT